MDSVIWMETEILMEIITEIGMMRRMMEIGAVEKEEGEKEEEVERMRIAMILIQKRRREMKIIM